MALTLNAEQKSIYDIFSGENQYIIPPYQRAYSWTNVQCKALFEDIKKAFYDSEQEGYFLGNIVLAKSREERNKLEVIDGQQRLTSLTLLLKVLLSFDKENKALYSAIWIKDRRTDQEIQRLETNIFMEKDFNYFKEVLAFDFSDNICDFVNEKDNLFKQDICYFYKELKEFSKHNDILKFSDFLLDNIYMLPIETEGNNADKAREKALKIFETINNRGLNLSTSDIFKARLYSMALNELAHEDFIKKWKKLYIYSDEIQYPIDVLFEIYAYIIQGKSIENKFDFRTFFLENKESPFSFKQYNEILNDLFKIIESINFYNDVANNPIKYKTLAKYFQIIKYIDRENIDKQLISELYKTNLSLYPKKLYKKNDSLIIFCRKYIRGSILDKYGKVYYKGRPEKNYKIPKDLSSDVIALLSFYLKKGQNAIYPSFSFKKILIEDSVIKLDQKRDEYDTDNRWRTKFFSINKYNDMKDSLGNKIVVDFNKNYSTFEEQIKLFLSSDIEEVKEIGKKLEDYQWRPIDLEKRENELKRRLGIFFSEDEEEIKRLGSKGIEFDEN